MRPKILVYDIETAPIRVFAWSLWNQHFGLANLDCDWFVLSFAAKWYGDDHVYYRDQKDLVDMENDKALLQEIWNLLDAADIVVTQNGKKFDQKKLYARFVINGLQPPSNYKHDDTLVMAKKTFAFTSNKLEYMTDALRVKHPKLKHDKFPGLELWKQCLLNNHEAWKEMELYNKNDVLGLEEVYDILLPWGNSVNFNLYHDTTDIYCTCGAKSWERNGYDYTPQGKFQRYRCTRCGAGNRSRDNLFTKAKRASLYAKV